MNIDGVFLHHLANELKGELEQLRINKLLVINNLEYALLLQNKKYLYICLNSNSPHVRISNDEEEFVKSSKTTPFISLLRKYCESSIIEKVEQIENDRVLVIKLISFDELGYTKKINLIIELFGRNSNAILTDENYIVIDCLKRLLPNDNDLRTLIPKIKYNLEPTTKINPFLVKEDLTINNFQGVSELCFNEMIYNKSQDIINSETKPSLIELDKRVFFYCFPLNHLKGKVTYFDSLSNLLYSYYFKVKRENHLNVEQINIKSHLLKSLKRTETKLEKQKCENEDALNNLKYEKLGNLLSSNLHLIKKGDKKITLFDYYENCETTITLDPLLSPSENMNRFFNKYKKAKRTLENISEQMDNTKNEINYYKCLLEQIDIAKAQDLAEISEELNLKKKTNKKNSKNSTPNITIFNDYNGNSIFVGKNNIQNNYLTNKFAKGSDYFFHVQGYSGSHTILRTTNLNDEIIKLAASVAALHSKGKNSSNVAVDYTLIKYVKKIPKTLGSFVTYTNQKTVFVTPNIVDIEKNLKRIK